MLLHECEGVALIADCQSCSVICCKMNLFSKCKHCSFCALSVYGIRPVAPMQLDVRMGGGGDAPVFEGGEEPPMGGPIAKDRLNHLWIVMDPPSTWYDDLIVLGRQMTLCLVVCDPLELWAKVSRTPCTELIGALTPRLMQAHLGAPSAPYLARPNAVHRLSACDLRDCWSEDEARLPAIVARIQRDRSVTHRPRLVAKDEGSSNLGPLWIGHPRLRLLFPIIKHVEEDARVS